MAAFSALTAEQQNVYLTFENNLRAWCVQQAKANNVAAALKVAYDNQILSILSSLNDNSIVPSTSNLAGSQSLDSDAEMAVLVGDLSGILTTYNTAAVRARFTKAAGAGNLV